MSAPASSPPPEGAVAPAGWHIDPTGRFPLRWWDGAGWSDHVAAYDPLYRLPSPAVPGERGRMAPWFLLGAVPATVLAYLLLWDSITQAAEHPIEWLGVFSSWSLAAMSGLVAIAMCVFALIFARQPPLRTWTRVAILLLAPLLGIAAAFVIVGPIVSLWV
jgi:hypothetical protein